MRLSRENPQRFLLTRWSLYMNPRISIVFFNNEILIPLSDFSLICYNCSFSEISELCADLSGVGWSSDLKDQRGVKWDFPNINPDWYYYPIDTLRSVQYCISVYPPLGNHILSSNGFLINLRWSWWLHQDSSIKWRSPYSSPSGRYQIIAGNCDNSGSFVIISELTETKMETSMVTSLYLLIRMID